MRRVVRHLRGWPAITFLRLSAWAMERAATASFNHNQITRTAFEACKRLATDMRADADRLDAGRKAR